MKITDALLTMGSSHGRTGKTINPKGIVIQGGPCGSALAYRNYFENGANGSHVSSHYIIGFQGEILRCIPETEAAQHAGTAISSAYLAQAKKNNSIYYGVAIRPFVSDVGDNAYFSLVELCADICLRHQFDPHQNLFTLYEVTGKKNPSYYVSHPAAWDKFKEDVQAALSASCLKPGFINLAVDGKTFPMEAENKDGCVYTTLENLGLALGLQAKAGICDVLKSNGYAVSWNADLLRITANHNQTVDFHDINNIK